MSLREAVFGRPIPDADSASESLGPASGVPVLGLDALASAAYGPEAALTVLIPLGAGGLGLVAPITAVIAALLVVVQLSYRQTIAAYPDGGGSYTVAKENLGPTAGLLAAAALTVDYVLNVAVAISAGVGALVSALPALSSHTLALCLGLLALLTLVNLRGLRTAGLAFMAPTYAFVGCLAIVIGVGLWRVAHGHATPVVRPHALPRATEAAGVWVVIRAFASGCTAMTGVEAVSNAVPVFRKPTRRNAQRTLAIIVAVLVLLLGGIAVLVRAYGIGATEPGSPGYESVLSQAVAAVMGRGAFYGVAIASIVSVLCLSANTSFADFPRLFRSLALDRFVPQAFAHAGRRLVYSTGIVVLASLAAALLAAFGGITDRLVPLFAVGAFLAFTLSQAGMVVHWRRRPDEPGARRALALNATGAALTGVTLGVVLVSKFVEGAWMTALFVPGLVLLLRRMHARYEEARRAAEAGDEPLDLADLSPPAVVVPLKGIDQLSRKALRFALGVSPRVQGVLVLAEGFPHDDVRAAWERQVARPAREAGLPAPELVVLRSQYRQLADPLLAHVRRLAAEDPTRFVAVVIPELVQPRWYHYLLFSHTATALKMLLLFRGGPQVVVVNAPWYLRPAGLRARWVERLRRRRAPVPLAVRTSER